MKSDRNIVYDIITASGLTIKREDISEESIKILSRYGYENWNEGDESARYELQDW